MIYLDVYLPETKKTFLPTCTIGILCTMPEKRLGRLLTILEKNQIQKFVFTSFFSKDFRARIHFFVSMTDM